MDVTNHMTERYTWNSPCGEMNARKQEFQVKGDKTWYLFLKYVHNRANDKEWVDAVTDTGFRAFRPERVVKVRDVPKPNAAIAAKRNGKQG